MMLRALVLSSLLALAACGQNTTAPTPPAPSERDPAALNIEVGRYGVMLDQVAALTLDRPGVGEPEATDLRDLSRRLRETVWRYNIERSRLCARGLFTDVACGPVFNPIWIADAPAAEPTIEEIRSRADEVGREVSGFWNVVCEDARTRAPDEEARRSACAIE
ncbi:MAG: hypothetical protein JNK94_06330 [Hyphomonadaceae bacterium]|nr:hypothetical protein [Hyphomonadaceae bacterium]MBX3511437.1 hypothetical protein [Hyphomonadaceae bacterium]